MYLDSICDSDLEFFSYIESFPFNYCVLDSVTLYKVMLLFVDSVTLYKVMLLFVDSVTLYKVMLLFVDSVTLYKVMLLIDLPCINSIGVWQ